VTGQKEYQCHLLRLDLRGTSGGFDYGFEHLYVGSEFENTPGTMKAMVYQPNVDRTMPSYMKPEGTRLWLGRSIKAFHITSSFSDLETVNKYSKPDRPHKRRTYGEVKIAVAFPSSPVLSLYYNHGTSKNSRETKGFKPGSKWFDTFGASIYYRRSNWDVVLSSTYSLTKGRLPTDTDSLKSFYKLSGSYSPTNSITIAPTFSLREVTYRSGVRYVTPTVSLLFTYISLFNAFDFTASGSSTRHKSSNRHTDTSTMDGTASLVWNLGKSQAGQKSLSFDVSHYDYLNAVYPDNSYNEFSALFTFKIAGSFGFPVESISGVTHE
jgi:hypothetical protein